MENSQLKLSPQEVFNNKKLLSNKIHCRILKINEDISKSFDEFINMNIEDKILIFNAVNTYHRDLCEVIFHLRQVLIKIDKDDQGVCDLQNVITELNKIVLLVQDSLNLDAEKFKIQLKGAIVVVGSQVEKLMQIIAFDNLHEHKQSVLDCQHDLAISTEALKLYAQCLYLSPTELEEILHKEIQKVTNNLMKIKTGNDIMAEDFAHYTRHTVKHLQNTVDYLHKMINSKIFHNDVGKVFKNACALAVEYIAEFLEAACSEKPMEKMLDIIENGHNRVSIARVELQKGLQISMEENFAKNDDRGVKHFVIHMLVNGINGIIALNQSIEDAIITKI